MRKRKRRPQFGEAGTKLMEYTAELPATFGPFVTKKIYRFGTKNPRLVDLRDLTLLCKVAGRDNLVEVDKITGKKKRRAPRRVREVKQEEAENAIE
jgi:hypothetical protein